MQQRYTLFSLLTSLALLFCNPLLLMAQTVQPATVTRQLFLPFVSSTNQQNITAVPLAPASEQLQAAAVANRPFPQHVTYAAGTLRPTNFTQAQQDDHVRAFYTDWKNNYLVAAGTNSTGQAMQRVAFDKGSSATVSEGQGYGMIITALMAGYDPNAQSLFDGLWTFARAHPSGQDNRLMTWKVDNGAAVEGNDSAFDGDVDMAYGLLLAHAQWGSSGTINYQAAATTLLNGILASTIGTTSRLPLLGDWVSSTGTPYNQYTPRSSDFMPAHFRAFGRATNNSVWNTVISNSQAVINRIQTGHSPTTGLLPDFIVNCNPVTTCAPASSNFLEGPDDGRYSYNAGRDPLRIGLDALLNNDAAAKTTVQKMVSWLAGVTGGNANNIKANYQLDGTALGNYFTTFFAAPFGVATMLAPTQQTFLNNIYASVYNRHEGYYEDSVTLLSLLVLTGNYWDPTQSIPTPNTPTPTTTPTPTKVATSQPTTTPTPTKTALPTATATRTTVPVNTSTPTATATKTPIPVNSPTPTAPPVSGCLISLNNGALFTNQRNVTLQSSVTGASQVQVSNDGGFVNAVWQTYQPSLSWSLPDIGQRIATLVVRARFRNASGVLLCSGQIASDEIIFDVQAPVVVVAATGTGQLQITAEDQLEGSGVVEMQISSQPDFATALWQPWQALTTITAEPGTTLYVRVRDGAGNESTTVSTQLTAARKLYLPFVTR